MINHRGSQCLALLITVAPSLGWSPCWKSQIKSSQKSNWRSEEIQLALTGRVFAGDHLDVDVLGHGGEGDLEATDGGSVAGLHLSEPAPSTGRVLMRCQMYF